MYVPTFDRDRGSFSHLPKAKRVPPTQLVIQTCSLNETPDETMLKWIRILERKIGVVLTLVGNNADAKSSSFDALDGGYA
jgi:hypothetical protein